jgi:hypothetical protein
MGRPKKNRRKAPEEKIKKGVKVFTKAGVTIHCSECGKANHNKKGHKKYLETLAEQRRNNIVLDDEDVDIPSILEVNLTTICLIHNLYYLLLQLTNYVLSMQHVIQQTTSPLLDPTQQQDNMIFRMQVEV